MNGLDTKQKQQIRFQLAAHRINDNQENLNKIYEWVVGNDTNIIPASAIFTPEVKAS